MKRDEEAVEMKKLRKKASKNSSEIAGAELCFFQSVEGAGFGDYSVSENHG